MSYPNQPDYQQGQYSQQGNYVQQKPSTRPTFHRIFASMNRFNLRMGVISLLAFGSGIWLFASDGVRNPAATIALIGGGAAVFLLNFLWIYYKARR